MKNSLMRLTGVAIFATIAFSIACGPNDRIMRSAETNVETPQPGATQPQVDEYTREVEAMRTAGLTTVFSIKRRDGQAFQADDRNVIRVNTALANRRVVGYDDKWAVIGTNTKLSDENLKALDERFTITNYAVAADVDKTATPDAKP